MAEKKTVEQLQQELLETKAQLNDAKPEIAAKPKPYTKAEIDEHHKNGHVIGAPNQKLSEGHDLEDLQEWEQWECEVGLTDIGKLPETGLEHSVPHSITPTKPHKKGLKGTNKTFQTMNKQTDFRYAGIGKPILYYLPKGKLEAGKKYDAHYGIEITKSQQGDKKHVRMYVEACPEITGITKRGNG